MDDILKRMLEVEAEAEGIVSAAEQQARDLMAVARKRANDDDAAEQAVSASEYVALIKSELAKAEAKRQTLLDGADAELNKRAAAFTAKIARHKADIAAALLGK